MYLLNACYFCRLMFKGSTFHFPLLSPHQEHLLYPFPPTAFSLLYLRSDHSHYSPSKPQEQEWCRFAEGMTAGPEVMCLFLHPHHRPPSLGDE